MRKKTKKIRRIAAMLMAAALLITFMPIMPAAADVTSMEHEEGKTPKLTFHLDKTKISVAVYPAEPEGHGADALTDSLADDESNASYVVEDNCAYTVTIGPKESTETKLIGSITESDEESFDAGTPLNGVYSWNKTIDADETAYTVTTAMGTIDADAGENGTCVPVSGSNDAELYSTPSYVITPNAGYYVSDVKVNDVSLTEADSNLAGTADSEAMKYTFEPIEENQKIEAVFTKNEDAPGAAISAEQLEITIPDSAVCNEADRTYILKAGTAVTVALNAEDLAADKQIILNNTKVGSYEIKESCTLDKLAIYDKHVWWGGRHSTYSLGEEALTFRYDREAPEMTLDHDHNEWVNDKSTGAVISGTVTDEAIGVEKVVCFDTAQTDASAIEAGSNIADSVNGTFQTEVEFKTSKVYYLYAIDKFGNISDATVKTFRPDGTAPGVSVRADTTGSFFCQHIYYFGEDKATFTATITDGDESGADLDHITVKINDEVVNTGITKKKEGDTVTVTVVSSRNVNKLEIIAQDMVGNEGSGLAFNNDGSLVVFDSAAPVISSDAGTSAYTAPNGLIYAKSEDTELNFAVEDTVSGIKNIRAEINGNVVANDMEGEVIDKDLTTADERVTKKSFSISASQSAVSPDGRYEVKVTAVDAVGHESVVTKTVCVDKTPASISAITSSAAAEKGTGLVPSSDIYGSYAPQQEMVTLTGSDTGCGVKGFVYYTVNNGTKSSEKTADASNGTAQITLTADFKGYVYAKAIDNLGNTSADYVTTPGYIAETSAAHSAGNHIALSAADTDKADAAGNKLYSSDTGVDVNVTDTVSGIRSVEWNVRAPYDTEADSSGSVYIDADGNIQESGWNVSSRDQNLVTGMTYTIPVTNNSDDITVTVSMTDRAGNTSTKSTVISVDKVSPSATVSFDNKEGDSVGADYFHANRTATFTVTERNFDAEAMKLSITNTDGGIPDISEWTENRNSQNPDLSTYTATVVFTNDGDYTLKMTGKDAAGHEMSAFAAQSFTIDKTLPEIAVTFSSDGISNGTYYNTARTATITVTEHNFDASGITISGNAVNDGIDIPFPAAGSWVTSGDTHTAALTFDTDAEYDFTVQGVDMAGNKAVQYSAEPFCIDSTDPVIEIGGVENMSANNDVVAPIVTFKDTNYDENKVSVKLAGANSGEVKLDGQYSGSEHGQTFTFHDFAREKAADDIYTLTASQTDMAGNATEQRVIFSVNRFGSVYVFDQSLKDIEGMYIQQAVDVVLTETNVDALQDDSIQVVLNKNGTPETLEKGTDYTVEKSGGNGSWSQYQYTIDKYVLDSDGTYAVTVYSKDRAGNVNENIDEAKEAEIGFGVDTTNPVVIPTDIESDRDYNEAGISANISIADNLVLSNVSIKLNGKDVEYMVDGDDYAFDIPESNDKQKVAVTAVDAAGNEESCEISNLLVSTNVMVRFLNNPAAVIAAAAAAGGAGIIAFRKKKLRIKFKKR